MQELPVAQLSHLFVQANTDSKKAKSPKLADFLLFAPPKPQEDLIPPDAAHVALWLQRDRLLPEEFLSAWPAITEAAGRNNAPVKTRAFVSDCQNLWILAPRMGSGSVRGLVLVRNGLQGRVKVRNLDRKLERYELRIPQKNDYCYIAELSLDLIGSGGSL